jgi:hypothetical protein
MWCFRSGTEAWGQKYKICDPTKYNWDSLCDWVEKMEESKLQIDQMHLDSMLASIYGLQTKSKHRTLLSSYCFRDRQKWTESERMEIDLIYPKEKAFHSQNNPDFDLDDAILETHHFTERQQHEFKQEIKYYNHQTDILESVLGKVEGNVKELVRCDDTIDEQGLDIDEEQLMGNGTGIIQLDNVILNATKHNIFDKARSVLSERLSLNDLCIEGTSQMKMISMVPANMHSHKIYIPMMRQLIFF